PHLYHRTTDEWFPSFEPAKGHMAKLNGDDLAHDVADAREYLEAADIPAAAVGIVGFCMGGTVSLWQAASGGFAASVTFYGGGGGHVQVLNGLHGGAVAGDPRRLRGIRHVLRRWGGREPLAGGAGRPGVRGAVALPLAGPVRRHGPVHHRRRGRAIAYRGRG